MTLSPRVGGLASKPVDVSPTPASQRYTSPDCETTKITYEFFNELIEIFTFAQTSYAVTNVPNDPNALKKLLDKVRTGGYEFTVGDLKIQDATAPITVYHVTGGATTHNKPRIGATHNSWYLQTRDNNGAYVSLDYQCVRGATGANSHRWYLADVQQMALDGNGLYIENNVYVDDILERTPDHGVNIDGVLLKDSDVIAADGNFSAFVYTDDILERTPDHGVNIDGVLLKDSDVIAADGNFSAFVYTDDIREKTAGHGVNIDGVLLKDGSINFGQDDLDYYEGGLDFTPTFNAAPTATVRYGKAIKIGNKVDIYIQISGTAAQRAALGSSVTLDIGNIPFISELTTIKNGFVSVTEAKGVYFYENAAESQSGFVSATNDVINLWHQVEGGRTIKTVADWAGGDFHFNIHASFITG